MPFFIKRKKQQKQGPKYSGNTKKAKIQVKVKDNAEISESSDDENSDKNERNNKDEYQSSSDEDETEEDRKLKLTKMYLKEIREEEKKRLENGTTEEIEASVEKHLHQDYLKKVGKLKISIGEKYVGADLNNIKFLKCREQNNTITCLCISSDDIHLYSGSKNGTVIKWSLKESRKLGSILFTKKNKGSQIIGHSKSILCIAISSDNKFLAVGDETNDIQIWNPDNLKHIHTFKGHKNSVTGLSFRKNTYTLYSCSKDHSVKIWSLDEMMYVETLFGHLNEVTSIDSLVRERTVTSGGMDNSIRIWKIPEESQLIYNGNFGSIDTVKLVSEDNFISGGSNGELCVWSTMKKKPLCSVKEAHGIDNSNSQPYWITAVTSYVYTDVIASGSQNGFICVWKLEAGCRNIKLLFNIPITGFINSLSFTSDGKYLIAGVGRDHRFGRWTVIKNAKNGIYVIPLIQNN